MSRTPVFMNEFDHIINVSEIRSVKEIEPAPSINRAGFVRIDFIESGYLELLGVTRDEFWEALKNASLTLQENRRSTGTN